MVTRFALLLVSASLTGLSYSQTCKVGDVQVKHDLDIRKLAGRWFELKWQSFSFVPVEFRFRDYEHYYVYEPVTGNLRVYGWGREKVESKTCFDYTGSIARTAERGKLIYTRPSSVFKTDKTVSSDYWIVDTDYVNYALTYGCKQLQQNGTCHPEQVESWLWGRNSYLPDHLADHVNTRIRQLCLNPTSYLGTQHGHPCPRINGAQKKVSIVG